MFRSENKDSNFIQKGTAVLLLLAVSASGLSACQKAEESVPELKDPIVLPDNYLKPEYGDVGAKQYLAGTVIPKLEPVYVHSPSALEKVYVKIGDEVKAGDLIASGIPTGADADLESVNSRISVLGKSKQISSETGRNEQEIFDLQMKLNDAMGQSDQNKDLKKQKMVAKVNNDYAIKNYNTEISAAQKQREELKDELNKLSVKAPVSGRVYYIRNLYDGAYVGNEDCICLIGDESEKFIELDYNLSLTYDIKSADVYSYINGELKELKPVEYTSDELSALALKEKQTSFKYICELPDAKVGDQIPIVLVPKDVKHNVLRIVNGAILYDGLNPYVYVKGKDGNVKKYISVGLSDDMYTEIKDGLKEDDEVMVSFTRSVPVKYKELEVTYGKYAIKRTEPGLASGIESSKSVCVDRNAVVEDVKNDYGDYPAGTEVATVDMTPKNSDIINLQNQIDSLNRGHSSSIKGYNESIKELKNKEYPTDIGEDAVNLMKQIDKLQLRNLELSISLENATHSQSVNALNKQLKAVKGSSKYYHMTYTLDEACKINTQVEKQFELEKRWVVYSSCVMSDDMLVTSFTSNTSRQMVEDMLCFPLFRKVKLVSSNPKKYKVPEMEATSCGFNGGGTAAFVKTEDGIVHILSTSSVSGAGREKLIIKLENGDKLFGDMLDKYAAEINEVELDGVISLPTSAIGWEESKVDGKKYYIPYVWVKTPTGPVMRYIQIYHASVNNPTIWVTDGLNIGETVLMDLDIEQTDHQLEVK